MFLEPKGRNWGPTVNWDDLGKLYAVLIITWTVVLLSGITLLIHKRHLPHVKLRNLPLVITSTTFLHIYLVKICLAYTTNGHFSCAAEYWIMCIYLPFGIALFQAYLVQLRSVWEQQQRLISSSGSDGEGEVAAKKVGLLKQWRNLSSLKKSYIVIALGMLVQLILTGILYGVTPTLQGDWSSYGNVTHAKGQALCRKSLVWIPSAFWQLFWTWVYGPYTLFRVRNIHDIHFWRIQVIVSILSGLPGTPLWLAALYSTKFKPVNIRFVPPMWLAPGIVVMQFVTIFFPLFEDWLAKRRTRRTLSLLSTWDSHWSNVGSGQASLLGSTPKPSFDQSTSSLSDSLPKAGTRIHTKESLRKVLATNPAPLLEFAATKDFSAENILFLIQVRRWRSAWLATPKVGTQLAAPSLMRLFSTAGKIYVSLINERTAEFPINIDGGIRSRLDAVFESAVPVRSPSLEYDSPTPFVPSSPQLHNKEAPSPSMDSIDVEKSSWDKNSTGTHMTVQPIFEPHPCVKPLTNPVPSTFSEHVFDEAEKSIEYLVLTNTWQRFVKDRAVGRLEDILNSPRSP